MNNIDSSAKEDIKKYIEEGNLEKAVELITKYEKENPDHIDIFSFKGVIYILNGKLEKAKAELLKGLKIEPNNFDILFNLGYLYEQKGDFIGTFYSYTNALNVAKNDKEKEEVVESFKRFNKKFRGSTRIIDEDGKNIIKTTFSFGDRNIVAKTSFERDLERKEILHAIEKNLDKHTKSVLEIEFSGGIISKNLSYLGLKVEGIDSRDNSLLETIIKNWNDTLLNPKQRKPFYKKGILNKETLNNLTEYDTIIIIPDDEKFYNTHGDNLEEIIENLYDKTKRQLFLKIPDIREIKEKLDIKLKDMVENSNADLKIIFENKGEDKTPYEIYMINKEPEDFKFFAVPKGLEYKNKESDIIEIELDKCRDRLSFGYTKDQWHPMAAFLNEYIENEKEEYKGSILELYYKSFQPNNNQEALFGNINENLHPIDKGFTDFPWADLNSKKLGLREKPDETRPGGNHFFGPNADDFGKKEVERLIRNYKYIESLGYNPEIFTDGYITGYLLKKDNDYRFIIREGQHRIPAMGLLGYEIIRCKFETYGAYPKIVDIKDIEKWPQVINGVFPIKTAERIFNRFFEADGKERALKLNFL